MGLEFIIILVNALAALETGVIFACIIELSIKYFIIAGPSLQLSFLCYKATFELGMCWPDP